METRIRARKNNSDEKKTFPKIKKEAILSIQIPFDSKINTNIGRDVSKLVEQLLKLNEEKQYTTLSGKLEQIQNRIDYCEQRINEIVCQLYKLTENEIALVENA